MITNKIGRPNRLVGLKVCYILKAHQEKYLVSLKRHEKKLQKMYRTRRPAYNTSEALVQAYF